MIKGDAFDDTRRSSLLEFQLPTVVIEGVAGRRDGFGDHGFHPPRDPWDKNPALRLYGVQSAFMVALGGGRQPLYR